MKKKILAYMLPAGLFLELVYLIGKRFIEFPDFVAYPILIISLILMVIGLVYNGYCFGKKENPFKR